MLALQNIKLTIYFNEYSTFEVIFVIKYFQVVKAGRNLLLFLLSIYQGLVNVGESLNIFTSGY